MAVESKTTAKEQDVPKAAEHSETAGGVVVGRTLKIAGETVVPGASLIIDGNVRSGALHAVGGIVARSLLGPVGVGIVALNSYKKSTSGTGLLGGRRSEK